MNDYLNQNEFAKACGISLATVRWHLAKGRLKAKKVMQTTERTLIPKEEIESYKKMAYKGKASKK